MFGFLRCVAEAVMANGVRGLVGIVPGGAFLYDVAADAMKRLKERSRTEQIKQEVLEAAQASNDQAKAAAEQIAREVAAGAPTEDRIALEMYLTQIPGAVRASLRRPDDPTGRSVPADFALNDPNDLLRRLPSRTVRFRPGDPLAGKSGWQLVELLGTGGFGEVWLTRNPTLAALKGAVKFGLDPQARDRLLRHEGALVSRVMEEGKHPNVVQLLDAHLEGDSPWLMYEYVGGGDLTALILSWQRLPIAERITRMLLALETLARAVGHFHSLRPPIVHRDLKPSNILVSGPRRHTAGNTSDSSTPDLAVPNPELKVADFGIGGVAAAAAFAQEAATRGTSAGVLVSQLQGSYTPIYASPQQQRGGPPDPRDDVHALGVIGYQMLTGKLDATLGADYAKTLRRLGVPEQLTEFLGDCAAHDPEHRPKDANEMAERLVALKAPGATPLSPPPRPGVASSGAVPAVGMIQTACPKCAKPLALPAAMANKRISCGACKHVFSLVPPAPPPPAPPPPPPEPLPLGEELDESDRPRKRTRTRDEDDEDDRPRRRSRRDEDEDDRPRPRARPYGPPVRKSSTGLWLGLTIAAILLIACVGVPLYFMYNFFNLFKPSQQQAPTRTTAKF